MNMKKILIIAHDSGLRGAERVVAEEARELMLEGWNVLVVIPSRNGGLYDYLGNIGVPRTTIRYFAWMGPGKMKGRIFRTAGNLLAIPQFLVLFKVQKPDIVHVHSVACGIGAISSRLGGICHVWHFHEQGPYAISADRPVFDLGERLSLALIRWCKSHFVAVSKTTARTFTTKLNVDEIGVIYQPINLNTEVSSSDKSKLEKIFDWPGRKLIVVGALIEWKDPVTILRAMASILKVFPDVGLFYVGSDPIGMGQEIDALALRLGVSENTFRIGEVENAHPAIRIADACVVAAIDEGFGRVQVEAMLSETSVVVADVPVNREVADESNVDFFKAGDSESLASAVISMFNRSENEQRRRRAEALNYAEESFSPVATGQALKVMLNSVLRNSHN
ncbi:glycosyltransferase family 4 protein [Sulfitobacter pontiacus]|uniref:glycosyltransferase family 4 protein n=1 Tax=Sulfitobacter pontiacus TaxID=60137 RepID=UPI0021A4BC33|nr:glycosyltransferase family 4 protein [Sulfitobacter pontiacus]UWR20823.1 glycosyltransferase family 4 protein [Sulfitobacter pontiacus]